MKSGGTKALGDRVRSSVAGNDLPFVPIHAHVGAQAGRPAAKLKERAAFADRTMSSPALRDGGQTHAADPSERLAQAAVGILHQQGTAENTRPQLPFPHHVGTVGCDENGNGQRRIAMFEHDGDRAVAKASGGTILIATPKNAETGTATAMRRPRTARLTIPRSG